MNIQWTYWHGESGTIISGIPDDAVDIHIVWQIILSDLEPGVVKLVDCTAEGGRTWKYPTVDAAKAAVKLGEVLPENPEEVL